MKELLSRKRSFLEGESGMFVYWFNNVHLSRLVFWHQEVASGPFCFLVTDLLQRTDAPVPVLENFLYK